MMDPTKTFRPTLRSNLRGALLLAVLSTTAALAPAAENGITVTGTGEAKAKPTLIELSAVISADAELTADAMVKFGDAKKKSLGAVENLKLANLKIEPQGMAVSNGVDMQTQMRMMQGMVDSGAAQSKTKTQVSETVKLTLTDIEKLQPPEIMELILKVIDTGRDAGLAIGPPVPQNYYQMQMAAQMGQGNTLAQFKLADASAVRDQAYQAAMTQARKKAEQLAALAGVKLGPVVAVQEGNALEKDSNTNVYRVIYGGGMQDNSSDATSNTFGEIPLKVTLTVQYAIEK